MDIICKSKATGIDPGARLPGPGETGDLRSRYRAIMPGIRRFF